VEAKEELLGVAQVAVALIGFSGLISVFRPSAAGLVARDLTALAMIIAAGSIALFFALFPLPLLHLGIPPRVAWAVSSAAFSLTLLGAVVVMLLVSRGLTARGHPPRTPRLNRTVEGLGVVLALLLLVNALGAGPLGGPGLYLFALIGCLAICVTIVAFLLVVYRRA
jgi:hypothetical protein